MSYFFYAGESLLSYNQAIRAKPVKDVLYVTHDTLSQEFFILWNERMKENKVVSKPQKLAVVYAITFSFKTP